MLTLFFNLRVLEVSPFKQPILCQYSAIGNLAKGRINLLPCTNSMRPSHSYLFITAYTVLPLYRYSQKHRRYPELKDYQYHIVKII